MVCCRGATTRAPLLQRQLRVGGVGGACGMAGGRWRARGCTGGGCAACGRRCHGCTTHTHQASPPQPPAQPAAPCCRPRPPPQAARPGCRRPWWRCPARPRSPGRCACSAQTPVAAGVGWRVGGGGVGGGRLGGGVRGSAFPPKLTVSPNCEFGLTAGAQTPAVRWGVLGGGQLARACVHSPNPLLRGGAVFGKGEPSPVSARHHLALLAADPPPDPPRPNPSLPATAAHSPHPPRSRAPPAQWPASGRPWPLC